MPVTKTAKATLAAMAFLMTATAALADPTPKERIRLFYDAFETADPSLLDRVLAPDWVDIPLNPGQALGREAFKPFVIKYAKIFANTKMITEDIIQEGNKIVVRSTFEGTNIGDFAGFPAKGRPVKIMTIDIHELNKDGLVAKTWHLEDWLGGLFQMGAFEK